MRLLLAVVFLHIVIGTNAQVVAIPDTNFLKALLSKGVDTNGDGKIQTEEALSLRTLDVSRKNIYSLKGIESFSFLEDLYCDNNFLDSLTLYAIPHLRRFSASRNKLVAVNLSACPKLEEVSVGINQLTALDVSSLPLLTYLEATSNYLDSLDLSHNPLLVTLALNFNLFRSLDVSKQFGLFNLYCSDNHLTELIVPSLALETLDAHSNQLARVEIASDSVKSLQLQANQLSQLNVARFSRLLWLSLSHNQLKSLDVSHNLRLDGLGCISNPSLAYVCVAPNALLYRFAKDAYTQWTTDCNLVTEFVEAPREYLTKVYPNPSTDGLFFIEADVMEPALRLMDISGQALSFEAHVAKGKIQLDLRHLGKGIYFLQIGEGELILSKKLIY